MKQKPPKIFEVSLTDGDGKEIKIPKGAIIVYGPEGFSFYQPETYNAKIVNNTPCNRDYMICYSCLIMLEQAYCERNDLPIKAVHVNCQNKPPCCFAQILK